MQCEGCQGADGWVKYPISTLSNNYNPKFRTPGPLLHNTFTTFIQEPRFLEHVDLGDRLRFEKMMVAFIGRVW